jgi:rod shape-determining protein MreD
MAVVLTVWVALVRGSRTGMVFGFVAGLLTGVLKPMELGWICLLLSATGYLIGNIKEKLVMDPLPVRILTLLIVAFAYNVLFLFFTSFELFFRNASSAFLSTFYTALYTTIVGAMVFYFIKYRYVMRNLF